METSERSSAADLREASTQNGQLKITNVKTICTAPDGIRLVIVKVETSEPEIYGLGCATFTQRPLTVVSAVEQYLKPLLCGRDPAEIEDIFQLAFVSSYWRNGPVLNNALSGVDMALWDIKGKCAGMPLYDLFGGRVRKAATLYSHAWGKDPLEVGDSIERFRELGYDHFRVQVDVPGYSTYGTGSTIGTRRHADVADLLWEPSAYARAVPSLFEHLSSRFGSGVQLIHDIHERLPPIQAIGLAEELQHYNLFFLEDPFAPEDAGYFRLLRQRTSIPVAMGELFVNSAEYVPLIKERLIDFIRVHISDIGGVSVARKLASMCEFFGVRTAWHGPGDVSPVGHAANMHLDLSCWNFGIQEGHAFSDRLREVFPGCPEVHGGMMWPNGLPGLGVDVNEDLAKKYPFPEHPLNGAWSPIRRADGSVVRP